MALRYCPGSTGVSSGLKSTKEMRGEWWRAYFSA